MGRFSIRCPELLQSPFHAAHAATSGVRGQTARASYIPDGSGSVSALLSVTGAALASYSYGSYGEARAYAINASGAVAYAIGESYYGYNSEGYDPMTGLQYLRARYYDSSSGRFGTADIYPGTLLDPLSQNPYSYTQGDPINFSDPSGHGLFSNIVNGAASLLNKAVNLGKTLVNSAVNLAKTQVAKIYNAVIKPVSLGLAGASAWVAQNTPLPGLKNLAYMGATFYSVVGNDMPSAQKYYQQDQSYMQKFTAELSARVNKVHCTISDRIQSTDWKANGTAPNPGLLAMMEDAKSTLQYKQAEAMMPSTQQGLADINNAFDALGNSAIDMAKGVAQSAIPLALRVMEQTSKKQEGVNIIDNYINNLKYDFSDYIYDHESGNAAKIQMGDQFGGNNGCGWVAAYNALYDFGNPQSPASIVLGIEGSGGAMSEFRYSANPMAIADYMDKKGYDSKVNFFPDSMDDQIKNSGMQGGIIIYINNLDPLNMHYVYTSYNSSDQQYYMYNSEGSNAEAFGRSSVDDWLRGRGYVPAGVISFDQR